MIFNFSPAEKLTSQPSALPPPPPLNSPLPPTHGGKFLAKNRNFPISGLEPMPSVKCQNVEKIHLTFALSCNLSYHDKSPGYYLLTLKLQRQINIMQMFEYKTVNQFILVESVNIFQLYVLFNTDQTLNSIMKSIVKLV